MFLNTLLTLIRSLIMETKCGLRTQKLQRNVTSCSIGRSNWQSRKTNLNVELWPAINCPFGVYSTKQSFKVCFFASKWDVQPTNTTPMNLDMVAFGHFPSVRASIILFLNVQAQHTWNPYITDLMFSIVRYQKVWKSYTWVFKLKRRQWPE